MKKKILVLFILLSLISVAYAKDLDVKLVINGETIDNKEGKQYILREGRILLDKDLLIKKLGMTSEIKKDDIILKKADNIIRLKKNTRTYYLNDIQKNMDTELVEKSGVYYIPLRLVSEGIGKEVKWDQETSTAHIRDKKGPVEEILINKNSNIGKVILKALDFHKNSKDLRSQEIRNTKNTNQYYVLDLDKDGYIKKKVEIALINNKICKFIYEDYENQYNNKRPIINAKDAKSLAAKFIKDLLGEDISLVYNPEANSSLSDPGKVEFFQSIDKSITVGVDRRENMVIFLEKN